MYYADPVKSVRTYLGSGVILDGHLITPEHVISDVPHDCVYIKTYDAVYHRVCGWFVIDTDLVAAPAMPGYKSASVRPVASPLHAKVVAARDQQNSSMGVVKHEREIAPSRLSYTGSTIVGFSGSPYTNGLHVLGIHMGGGGQGNYGVSASYVVAALRRQRKPESSELLAIQRALRSAKRSDVFVEPTLDDVRLEVNGHFWMISRDEYDELLDDDRYVSMLTDYDEEAQETVLRRNWAKRARDYYDEPDFEPEGGREAASFLASSPQKDSELGALSMRIDSQDILIQKIQDMQTSIQEAIIGLRDQQTKSSEAFACTLNIVQEQLSRCESQTQQKLSTLMQRLTSATPSCTDAPPVSTTQTGSPISTGSLELSTQKAQQALVNSETGQQSETRWDGMDSDITRFLEWRNSVNVFDPEYVNWRETFLTRDLGLTASQAKKVVKTAANRLKRLQAQAARQKRIATQ